MPVKPMKHRLGQNRLHGLVQLAGLGAVAFIDEDEDLALGLKVLRQAALDLGNEGLHVLVAQVIFTAAEFVDQRADQPRLRRC